VLGVVKESGRQMLVLLSDLLEMAAIENDQLRVRPTPSCIEEVVADIAMIWEKQAHARGLTLAWSCTPAAAALRAFDADRVRQVLGNLLSNAHKFTTRGGIEIHADVVDADGGEDLLRISVRDTGEGVAEADQERVFEPFEQADLSTRRRQGGMGVGLHVARKLARAMGGDLALESERGAGSVFILCVPAPKARPEPVLRPPTELASHGTHSILCVDDNPRNLLVVTRLLEAAGHEVTACESGRAALDIVAKRPFDLVLLDMVMPEMDGLDVIAQLRAMPGPNQGTPVVACTANVLPEQIRSYLAAGVESVVGKPIEVRGLLEAVSAAALSRSRAP
jgi:two-component system, sensor histidine kinase